MPASSQNCRFAILSTNLNCSWTSIYGTILGIITYAGDSNVETDFLRIEIEGRVIKFKYDENRVKLSISLLDILHHFVP